MTRQLACLMGLLLTLSAGSAWAAPSNQSAGAPGKGAEPVDAGIAFDESPDEAAIREEENARWERDARAAGIDPTTAEAQPGKGKGNKQPR